MLSAFIDRFKAGVRARDARAWMNSKTMDCMLKRHIFQEIYGYLVKYPATVPGLVCPDKEPRFFNQKYECVEAWLFALRDHYESRIARCHVHPEAFDEVHAIFERLITRCEMFARKEQAQARRAAEINGLVINM